MKRAAAVVLLGIVVAAAVLSVRACDGDTAPPRAPGTGRAEVPGTPEAPRLPRVRAPDVVENVPAPADVTALEQAKRTARLTVIVRAKETTEPIPGARLLVHDSTGHRELVADAQGCAVLDAVPEQIDLVIVAPGRARRHEQLNLGRPNEPRERTYVLERGAQAIGRITDAQTGEPIAGAALAIRTGGFDGFAAYYTADASDVFWDVGTATSAADGSFSIDGLAPGQVFSLHASAAGHADGERPATPYVPGPCACDLALNAGRTVTGRVLDEAGVAVVGVEVICRPAWVFVIAGPFGVGRRTCRTDHEGRFSFAKCDEDGVLLVRALRDHPIETPEARIAPGTHDEVLLRFERTATLRVLQRQDRPANGSADVIRIGSLGERVTIAAVATDGVEGTQLSPGHYCVMFSDERPPEVNLVLAPGEDRTCEIARLGGTLTGRVVDRNGTPVAAARVDIDGADGTDAEVETDERGEFRVVGLPPGPATITIGIGTEGVMVLRSEMQIPSPHRDWVLLPNCVARILFPPEAVGRHVWVKMDVRSISARNWGVDGWELEQSSDEQWEYDPAEPMKLDAYITGPLRFRVWVEGFVTKVVETAPARGQDFDVVVGPLVPGVRVAGRVVDPESAPVGSAEIELVNPGDPRRGARCDENGHFRTDPVEPGTIRLRASGVRGFLERTISTSVRGAADEPVTIVLYHGGFVDVVAVDAHDAPVTNRELDVRDETGAESTWGVRTDHRGRASIRLNPGVHRVATEGADTATVTVVEGARQTLRLVVR